MYIRCLLGQFTFIASICLLTQRRRASQAPGNATPSRLLSLVLISKKCGSFSGVTKLCRIKKSTYTSPQLGFISPEWRASISSGIVRSYAISLVIWTYELNTDHPLRKIQPRRQMVLDEHILQSLEEGEEDHKGIQFLPNNGFRLSVLRVLNHG